MIIHRVTQNNIFQYKITKTLNTIPVLKMSGIKGETNNHSS